MQFYNTSMYQLTWVWSHGMPVVFKYLCRRVSGVLGVRNILDPGLPVWPSSVEQIYKGSVLSITACRTNNNYF